MALWGQGDPRWIVEERPDATNVNNWHWTEKNAGPWSQDKLKELFKNLSMKNEVADVKITEIEKIEGEASANNRKGKLIFFYEWNIVLKWQGCLVGGSGSTHNGKITIPNLSEENDVSEVEITVTLQDGDKEGEIVKEYVHTIGKEHIRKKLTEYITKLKEEFSRGMILPKKEDLSKPQTANNIKDLSSGFNNKVQVSSPNGATTSKAQASGVKLDTKTLTLTHKFQCRASEFYDAMTRIEMVMAWTHGDAKLCPEPGGEFSLFGGNISGNFKELVEGKKIVQMWRVRGWPSGHHSTVTMDIDEKSDHTEVKVTQSGIPAGEYDSIRANWDRYYWDAIKKTFGFGAFFT